MPLNTNHGASVLGDSRQEKDAAPSSAFTRQSASLQPRRFAGSTSTLKSPLGPRDAFEEKSPKQCEVLHGCTCSNQGWLLGGPGQPEKSHGRCPQLLSARGRH